VTVERWTRTDVAGEPPPTLAPAGTGYAGAVLHLPQGTQAAELALHVLAGRLLPDGELWVAGANDEGGRSAVRRVAQVMEATLDVTPGGHARRIRAARPRTGLRADPLDWMQIFSVELPTLPGTRPWVSFPGLFARGGIDPATALLLRVLPPVHGRVLDLACGTGVIAAVLAARGATVEAADHDVYAVEAARRNLGPSVQVTCTDGLPPGRWDAVVCNPPIHVGAERDWSFIERTAAGAQLDGGGAVFFVTQRTVPVPQLVQSVLPVTRRIGEDRSFTVWRSSR
jgi:16S rRNA (guanine1207-N2)-methyltransferase